MECVISLDLGTTGVKAALFSRDGRVLAREYRSYPVVIQGDLAEQDPVDWWDGASAVAFSVAQRLPASDHLSAVVLSGQMQDLIPIGPEDALGSAILYSDARARKQAEIVERTFGSQALKERTGNIQDAASLLARLVWLKEEDASRWERMRCVLFGAHDYVSWKLTGNFATDFTTVSTTGLLDIRANTYAREFCDALGIPMSRLPRIVRADETDGGVLPEAAHRTGLPEGLPVLHGTGDVGSTTIAAGAGQPGVLSCYLGTSGWLAATSEGALVDPETGIYNLRHPDPSRIINVGPMLVAAGNVEWAVRTLAPGTTEDAALSRFSEEAGSACAGSGGLLYLPYLAGERSPFRDPSARGGFIGLSLSTTRAQMFRAVLEGVAFAMKTIHDAAGASLGAVRRISLSGGGSRSALWPQIFADVFGCDVVVPSGAEDAGLQGAYAIARKALGWAPDYLPSPAAPGAAFSPRAENLRACEAAYAAFRELYPALRGSFSMLADVKAEERRTADSRHDSKGGKE